MRAQSENMRNPAQNCARARINCGNRFVKKSCKGQNMGVASEISEYALVEHNHYR